MSVRRKFEIAYWSPVILTLPEPLFHVDPLVSSFLEVPVSLPFCNYSFMSAPISFMKQTGNYILSIIKSLLTGDVRNFVMLSVLLEIRFGRLGKMKRKKLNFLEQDTAFIS